MEWIWWIIFCFLLLSVFGMTPAKVSSVVCDLLLLPFALLATFVVFLTKGFHEKYEQSIELKNVTHARNKNNILVVFLHGSGFNWVEWMPTMWALQLLFWRDRKLWVENKVHPRHIRFLTFNYAEGWLSNAQESGVEMYANVVTHKLNEYTKYDHDNNNNNKNQLLHTIFVGHSLGGLVANLSAQLLAKCNKKWNVLGIVTIGTPWRGSPLIERLPRWIVPRNTRRYEEMMPSSAHLKAVSKDHPIHALSSRHDFLVPGECGLPLTSDSGRLVNGLGHYSLICSLNTWRFIMESLYCFISESAVDSR